MNNGQRAECAARACARTQNNASELPRWTSMSGESYLVEIFLPLADNLGRRFPSREVHSNNGRIKTPV